MIVETLVLNQHKIKARHKIHGLGCLIVLLYLTVAAEASDNVSDIIRNNATDANIDIGNDDIHVSDDSGNRRLTKRSPRMLDDKVQSYLANFGYLEASSNSEIANLRTKEQVTEAVKNLQRFGNIPVTGIVDDATLALMKKPRCGLPDTPPLDRRRTKRFTLDGRKWDHTDLTWSLRTERVRHYDRGRLRDELRRALDVWSKHSKLTFREVNDDRADILIYFEKENHWDGYPFDGPGKILAHAFFPGSGRGGDAHFDIDEDWMVLGVSRSANADEGISLYLVASHEFGHSLGLSHSSVYGSLMFPWYGGTNMLDDGWELPEDDKMAIQSLYDRKEEKSWAVIPRYSPSPDLTTRRPEVPRPRHPTHHHPEHHPTPESPRREPPPRHPNQYPETPQDSPRREPSLRQPNQYPETPHEPRRDSPPRHPNQFPETPRKPPARYPDIARAEPRTTPTTTTPPATRRGESNPGPSDKPDTCDTSYDAIAVIRTEVFVFKDRWMWRIGDKGVLPGYPVLIHQFWSELPHNLTHIDAVYQRIDNHIAFFIGRQYFLFEGIRLLPGYPRPLTALGLPASLERIDAAMVWGYNSKTYLFSGTRYWKLDDETGRSEPDYPRNMTENWRGVGVDIDDAFQWKDGATYFFKGKGFWKFKDVSMRVEKEKPSPSAQFWMKCPEISSPEDRISERRVGRAFSSRSTSGGLRQGASVALLTAAGLLLLAVIS